MANLVGDVVAGTVDEASDGCTVYVEDSMTTTLGQVSVAMSDIDVDG